MSNDRAEDTCIRLNDMPEMATAEKRRLRYLNSNQDTEEIYLPVCDGTSVGGILYHAYTVFTDLQDGDYDGSEHFALFKKTTNGAARLNWNSVYAAIPNEAPLDMARLRQTIVEWVATYATSADRSNLLHYLRSARKPRAMNCQQTLFALQLLNSMADMLPGNEAILTNDELKIAYHDLMPATWVERFATLGRDPHDNSINELRVYFERQERLAIRLENANRTRQRQNNRNRNNANDNNEDPPTGPDPNNPRRRARPQPQGDTSNNNQNNPDNQRDVRQRTGNRIPDDTPCPIHPNGTHTWGECYSNRHNQHGRNGHQTNGNQDNREQRTRGNHDTPVVDQHTNEILGPANDTTPPCEFPEPDGSKCPGHSDDPNLFHAVHGLNRIKLHEIKQQFPCRAWKHYKLLLARDQMDDIGRQLAHEGYDV